MIGAFLILLLLLLTVGFFYWQNEQNKREIIEQLTQNYWNNAINARKSGQQEQFLFFATEAQSLTSDPVKYRHIGISLQPLLEKLPSKVIIHEDGVSGAMFNQAEDQVLSWSLDGSVRVWSLAVGGLLYRFDHGRSVYGAMFNQAEDQVLSWSDDGSVRLWNISFDYDFPNSSLIIPIVALTGKQLNKTANIPEMMQLKEWQENYQQYQQLAKEHWRVCQYPHQNLWAKHHPQAAKKIRPDVVW